MAKKEAMATDDLAFNSVQMIAENAEKGTKVKYNERLKVEILHDTRYYRAGQIINPHKVKGQALIDQGLAKKVKSND